METYCTLYSDCFPHEFLALNDTIWQQLGLTARIRQEVEALRQMMDTYAEPLTDTDAGILADPKWHAVVK